MPDAFTLCHFTGLTLTFGSLTPETTERARGSGECFRHSGGHLGLQSASRETRQEYCIVSGFDDVVSMRAENADVWELTRTDCMSEKLGQVR